MMEDPSLWPEVALSEGLVAEIQPGFACGANTRSEADAIAHLRPMNITRDGVVDLSDMKYVPLDQADSERRIVRYGDVLFNNTNTAELVGKTAFYGEDTPRAFSNHMTRLRANLEAVDPRYLALALHARWREGHFEDVCNNHVSQASVNRKALLETKIILPPLTEQIRLVEEVEALSTKLAEARLRCERSRKLLRAFMASAFDSAASEVPSATVRLGDIAQSVEYGYTAAARHDGDGPRFLRITDIQNGRVNWASVPSCAIPHEKEAKYALAVGDIVFARTGATTGKSFLIDECPRAVFASYLIRVRASDAVLPEYLYAYFQSSAYWEAISEQASGNAQPGVNATKLRNLKIPVPSLDDQKAVVQRLRQLMAPVDSIEARLASSARAVEGARASLFGRVVSR